MMTVDMYYFSLYENYQEKYNHLKQKFIEIASLHVNAGDLQVLKKYYHCEINSNRALDNIKNLLDLLKVLEKRLVLSYNSIEPLKYIESTFIKDPVLNNAIKEYELQLKNQRQIPPFNVYKCKSGEYLSRPNEENSIVFIKVNPSGEPPIDSEESKLLCYNAIHDHSQPSAEILSDTKNSDQIDSLQYSNLNDNRLSFIHLFNINIIVNFFLPHQPINCIFIRAIMVLVVIFCSALIIIAMKPSVSSIPPSTSIRDDSGITAANQTILVNPSTAFSSSHQSLFQQKSRDSEKPNSPTPFQTQVFQYLSENLGRSWRDLARFLDVKEAEIDSIDLKTHYDYQNRALEALEIFRKRCDPSNWKKKLIKSLEQVRRKDLAEHVTDMIIQSDNN